MADVFAAIPLERHTGLGWMTVAELRQKYGPGLQFTVDPAKFRIVRGWERSQVQVLTLHFQTDAGGPVSGVKGRYFWPGSPEEGLEVTSNGDGNIDWAFSAPSFYDPPAEVGPYTFKADGLTITGMGSPSKNHPYNHDSMSYDIVVNPVSAGPVEPPPVTPPPSGGDVNKAFIESRVKAIRMLLSDIEAAIS